MSTLEEQGVRQAPGGQDSIFLKGNEYHCVRYICPRLREEARQEVINTQPISSRVQQVEANVPSLMASGQPLLP